MQPKPTAYGIDYRGHVIRIGTDALVGRSPSCKVILDHPDVSRRHARLSMHAKDVVLEDLGSANGVFVNGQRVEGSRRLVVGDQITIGGELMRFVGVDEVVPRRRARVRGDDAAEGGFLDDLWDDEHESRFDQGEATQLSSVATKLAVAASRSFEKGSVAHAEQQLRAALDYIVKRSQSGSRISAAEIEKVSRVLLEVEGHARSTGASSCDWLQRLAEVLAAASLAPPRALVEPLSGVLSGASPAATAAWRRYLAQLRGAPLRPRDRGLLLVVEQALSS